MLLFTFNLGAYSANGNARPMPWYDKIARLKVCGYAMRKTTPGIDYGLYDYDMSVIYYNTVTM